MIFIRQQALLLLPLLLATILLAGCGGVPYQSGQPIYNENLSDRFREVLWDMYPHSARVTERVIITSTKGEMVFTGILFVSRDTDKIIQLVGLGDFGKVIFSLSRMSSGKIVVERNPFEIGVKQLTNGPLQDAKLLYQPSLYSRTTLERRDENTVSLVNTSADGLREEFRFDTKNYRWIGYYRVRDNRCFYEATFKKYEKFENWHISIPREIVIRNYKMNYSACVNVVDVVPTQHNLAAGMKPYYEN